MPTPQATPPQPQPQSSQQPPPGQSKVYRVTGLPYLPVGSQCVLVEKGPCTVAQCVIPTKQGPIRLAASAPLAAIVREIVEQGNLRVRTSGTGGAGALSGAAWETIKPQIPELARKLARTRVLAQLRDVVEQTAKQSPALALMLGVLPAGLTDDPLAVRIVQCLGPAGMDAAAAVKQVAKQAPDLAGFLCEAVCASQAIASAIAKTSPAALVIVDRIPSDKKVAEQVRLLMAVRTDKPAAAVAVRQLSLAARLRVAAAQVVKEARAAKAKGGGLVRTGAWL